MDFSSVERFKRLPAAFVDRDAFDQNVKMIDDQVRAAKLKLRLATKSLRVPELIRRALKSSQSFRGLMCFSAEEILFLSHEGFDDFLLAYPTLQASDLKCLVEVHRAGKDVKVVLDHLSHAKALSDFLGDGDTPFQVVIDFDFSLRLAGQHLGVRRSPIRSIRALSNLMDSLAEFPKLKIIGVMGYEAQVAGLPDRNPFKPLMNFPVRVVRWLSVRKAHRLRKKIVAVFEKKKIRLELHNGGGSGSLKSTLQDSVTEVTAGSAFLCPHLFSYYRDLPLKPALFFALQGVRQSDSGFLTCQGGGYVSSGEVGWDKVPVPYWPPGLRLIPMEGCGEVQTPLRGSSFQIGDQIFFRPAKAGELAERFNAYHLLSGNRVVEEVQTYRGMGKCFF